MGTLSTAGIISEGDITTSARTKYRDNVVTTLSEGITLGATTLPPKSISMGNFETDPIDTVNQNFPAWHGLYVDGLQKNIALLLDSIPPSAILKFLLPVPQFDPTEPVAIVINELQDLSLQIEALIGIPIADVLISQIKVTIEKSEEITVAISDGDPEAFFEGVKSTISAALEAEGVDPSEVIEKIDEQKDKIVAKGEQIIEDAKNAIEEALPDIPIPALDISFMDPTVDVSPIFATVEANGYDGIATKFIKMMTVFLAIPSKIVEAAQKASDTASAAIKAIVDALNLLITDFQKGIVDLLNAVIGFIWDLISQAIGIISTAFLEISSIINIVFFFAKCFIISIIGFLLGAGLIALAAAKAFNIA